MGMAKVWEEKIVIPTYPVGKEEKNPMFIDKRVYQGSSGKVYPYPTIETINDIKEDVLYKAVYLENDYLKVMVLPELGCQTAYCGRCKQHFIVGAFTSPTVRFGR